MQALRSFHPHFSLPDSYEGSSLFNILSILQTDYWKKKKKLLCHSKTLVNLQPVSSYWQRQVLSYFFCVSIFSFTLAPLLDAMGQKKIQKTLKMDRKVTKQKKYVQQISRLYHYHHQRKSWTSSAVDTCGGSTRRIRSRLLRQCPHRIDMDGSIRPEILYIESSGCKSIEMTAWIIFLDLFGVL
jgi:hypothetical protein